MVLVFYFINQFSPVFSIQLNWFLCLYLLANSRQSVKRLLKLTCARHVRGQKRNFIIHPLNTKKKKHGRPMNLFLSHAYDMDYQHESASSSLKLHVSVKTTHQSGNKLQTSSIIVYILATTRAEAHPERVRRSSIKKLSSSSSREASSSSLTSTVSKPTLSFFKASSRARVA